jgi:hypothetical protein
MLVNYSNPAAGYELDALSVIRTTWVRIQGRYPELSRESPAAAGSTFRIELANNLLWDQQYYIDSGHFAGEAGTRGQPAFYQLNWVGNLGVARPRYPYGMLWFENPSGRSTVFFRDNQLNVSPTRRDWQLNYCCDDFASSSVPARPAWAVATRHDFPAVNYLPVGEVRRYVIAHAGAFPRDPMDRRLMGYVVGGVISTAPAGVNPAGDTWRTDFTTPPEPPRDSDGDGMPDEWERAHGTNPAAQDHNGIGAARTVPGAEGYNNLEAYLHELSERRLVEGVWGARGG